MVPIIQQWKHDYNFVGSFYIDIGDNPPGEVTDWTKSAPYYRQLLAMGDEIGSHSYTHPDDTNLLVPTSAASPQLLALLAKTDPRDPNAIDPSTLSASDRALLNTSFQFQFQYSKLAIEKALGITIKGTAVPGNIETVDTAHQIIQYYDYISGGYSGVGAGFPNAFGFLTPADLGKVYLAPNMKFDFSLVGFQHLSPAAATAEWLNEFAQINSHATTPIFVWPWHDYGVTNWNVGGAGPYDLSMYTSVLDAAAASGTEFVTSQDLANRIEEFQASKLTISQTGNDVIATLTSPDAGKFALTVGDTTTQIASATLGGSGWYAWEANRLLLPASGGTFDITLGTPADVTHLAELPMRADLQSATGDGTNLSFSFTGSGTATVDLQTQGTSSVITTGADSGSVIDAQLLLTFTNDGTHSAQIKYSPGGAIIDTFTNELIIAGTGPQSFLFDTTLNANTTVFDFSSVDDKVLLSHSIFAQAGSIGTLAAGAFNIGLIAANSDNRIIYNSSTGALLYDADGSGSGAATRFATVSPGLALTNNN